MAVGDGAVLVTTDDGATWRTLIQNRLQLGGISCPTPTLCIAVGSLGVMLIKSGPADIWTVQPSFASTDPLRAIACPTTTQCLAVGDKTSWSTKNFWLL